MARTKRISTDASDFHVKLRRAIAWPAHAVLPDDEDAAGQVLDHFAAIVESRAASDWSVAELLLAANLANCQYMVGLCQRDVYSRGLIVEKEGSKGQTVCITNPSADALNRLLSQAGSLASKLSLPAGGGINRVNKSSLRNHAAERPARFESKAPEVKGLWKDRHLEQ